MWDLLLPQDVVPRASLAAVSMLMESVSIVESVVRVDRGLEGVMEQSVAGGVTAGVGGQITLPDGRQHMPFQRPVTHASCALPTRWQSWLHV